MEGSHTAWWPLPRPAGVARLGCASEGERDWRAFDGWVFKLDVEFANIKVTA